MSHNSASTSQIVTIPYIAELFNPSFLDVLLPIKGVKTVDESMQVDVPKNAMMAALQTTTHQALTENGAMTYDSTGSPLLDAFQGITRDTYGRKVDTYLDAAWKEDADMTLKLIWSLRSIHDGKGEKEVFYRAYGWLLKHHPRTAIDNLHLIIDPVCIRSKETKEGTEPEGQPHGYYKDLISILALATVDQLSTIDKEPAFLHAPKTPTFESNKRSRKPAPKPTGARKGRAEVVEEKKVEKVTRTEAEIAAAREKHINDQKLIQTRKHELRKAAASEAHERLITHLKRPEFTALYVAVARIFAQRLAEDIRLLAEAESIPAGAARAAVLQNVSLAGKWAPTPQNSHDSQTNISTTIAILLHQAQVLKPSPALPVLAAGSPYSASDCHILRALYQRHVLTPLRRVSKVVEPLMSSGKWKEIQYSRVPSASMKLNSETFYKHNPEGFEAYLTDVESGKKTISGATLWPHELVGAAMVLSQDRQRGGDGDETETPAAKKTSIKDVKKKLAAKLADSQIRVIDQQWKALVTRLKESGKLDSAIAVCDVSGSMGYIYDKDYKKNTCPILPSVALSLILGRLASPPFANSMITFSANPQFHALDPSLGLIETVEGMMRADWGMNTDLEAVFLKLILPLAIKEKVPQDQMIKRVFIFSDMQFDEGCSNHDASKWETTHDTIEKAYKNAGYEMPQIVYWDLSGGGSRMRTPVTAERKGTALMSGFSPALLKVFMGESEDPAAEVDEWEKVDESGGSETVVAPVKEAAEFDPISVMKKALTLKSYSGLKVLD